MVTKYSAFTGKPVVMNIVSGTSKVALPCRIVRESERLVRVRISDQWDVDIYKEMIAGIEFDAKTSQPLARFF